MPLNSSGTFTLCDGCPSRGQCAGHNSCGAEYARNHGSFGAVSSVICMTQEWKPVTQITDIEEYLAREG